MRLQKEPDHVDHYMNCWLVALASFLDISYYEAHVVMFGGPPPPNDYSFSVSLDELDARFRELGFVRARKNYRKTKEDRYVIGCWATERYTWGTLHAIAWNGTAHDAAGYDSLALKRSFTVRVYRLTKPVKVVGVFKRRPKPIVISDPTLTLAA